jgi:drug/metabolite transporter (DMT)-like permease
MKGYLLAILATALWSGNFIIARGMSDSIGPGSLGFFRWAVAVLVLLPFVLRSLIAERQLIRANIAYLAITGFLGVTTFNTLIYTAGQTTTAINMSLIALCFPAFVLLLLRLFYREKISTQRIGGVIIVLVGVLLLITRGELSVLQTISFVRGDLWMLCASFVFAVYNLQVKRKPRELSFWTFQFCTFLFGLLFLSPLFIWESLGASSIVWEPATAVAIGYAGVVASLIAFGQWNRAIFLIGPGRAGLLYYTLPLFSGFWAVVLLGEEIRLLHLFCGLLVLSGIFIASRD